MDNDKAIPPVLDCSQIDGLVAAAGHDGAKSILEAFWRSTNQLVANLHQQLASGDLAEAARTAHALKGSALNVGAVRLSGVIRAIEDACRRRDAADAVARSQAVKTHYDETVAAFDRHLAA